MTDYGQPPLFDVPLETSAHWGDPDPRAYARRTDPDTSHQAAASLGSEKIRRSQAEVLELLREVGPVTDAALVHLYEARISVGGSLPQSPSGIRTRRRELVELGKVRDTGARVRLPSGRLAAVWEVIR